VTDYNIPDSPAALASLSAMRGLLVLLKRKGVLTAGEIVGMLHDVEAEGSADPLANAQLHSAYIWLRMPHLVESVLEFSKVIEAGPVCDQNSN